MDLRHEIVPVGTRVRFNGGYPGTITRVCNPRAFEPIVWEPSDWERLLQQLGIKDDEQAMKVLMAKGERSKQLRLWLGEFAHRKFVPVKVLEQVGLKRAVEGRFEHSWN